MIGKVAGAFPARAGTVVERVDAIQEKRWRINGLEEFTLPVRAITPDAFQDPLEMVIIAVKTWDSQETADQVVPWLGLDSFVVPLQNGYGAAWVAACGCP